MSQSQGRPIASYQFAALLADHRRCCSQEIAKRLLPSRQGFTSSKRAGMDMDVCAERSSSSASSVHNANKKNASASSETSVSSVAGNGCCFELCSCAAVNRVRTIANYAHEACSERKTEAKTRVEVLGASLSLTL
jgi:hypothetical protein